MEILRESDIITVKQIYFIAGSVEVKIVKHILTGRILCMKKLFIQHPSEVQLITSEFISLATLKDENIMNFISVDYSFDYEGKITSVNIFTEYYSEGDMKSYIITRKNNRDKFKQIELISYLKSLVGTFAFLQKKCIAHRDIKPENIFVSNNGQKLIIGDFGSSILKNSLNGKTVVGTPLYLSPKIREQFMNNTNLVIHDVFKSDVYSLGLTFLSMALLDDLSRTGKAKNRQKEIENLIEALDDDYFTIKEILRLMLKYEENERCDFIELSNYLDTLKETKLEFCKICEKEVTEYETFPEFFACKVCYREMLSTVSMDARLIHTNASKCTDIYGSVCSCGVTICKVCKNVEHKGVSCLKANLNSDLIFVCFCSARAYKYPYSYFIKCEVDHIRCLVCMQEFNQSDHNSCIFLYTNISIT